MVKTIEQYGAVIGRKEVERIKAAARPLAGKHLVHVNSTYYGGGVAEMLSGLVPLLNNIGIRTGWRSIKGGPDFFSITKGLHNAIQGEKVNFSKVKQAIYEKINENNASFTHIEHHDCIVIHDPQPLPIIKYYHKTQPWIWRCHIDLSHPNKEVWNELKKYINRYDRVIVSREEFKQGLSVPQVVIHPAIDPLSPKNKPLSRRVVQKFLKKFKINTNQPIISQISRFDKWKDPLGVIAAYKLIRKQANCQLVLLGSMATDDPEGQLIYSQVLAAAAGDKNIHVINYENDVLVNALQRGSSVVIQKSLREGFGLTVSEALWKKTPVVASRVGGIDLQVKDGFNGYLVDSVEATAEATVKLLKDKKKNKEMGREGQETVKKKFLVTRLVQDYINLLKEVLA